MNCLTSRKRKHSKGTEFSASTESVVDQSAPAAATSVAAASTTASAAVAATATAAAAPILAWLGFVDRQPPAVMLVVVERLDRCLSLSFGVHLHEPEPLGAVRVPVHDDLWRSAPSRTA